MSTMEQNLGHLHVVPGKMRRTGALQDIIPAHPRSLAPIPAHGQPRDMSTDGRRAYKEHEDLFLQRHYCLEMSAAQCAGMAGAPRRGRPQAVPEPLRRQACVAGRATGGGLMWLIPSSIRSAFAPASECLTMESELRSAISGLSQEQWPMVSGKHLQPASLLRLWKRERWSQRLCGAAIFDECQQRIFADAWISSLRASRARTSASQADALAWMGSARACSSTSSTLPTLAVRGGLFWRTSAPSLLPPPPLWTKPKALSKNAPPPASWENWPTEGGTRNGSLFPRPTWAPAMGAHGGFALLGGTWPTPDTGAERINRSPSPGAAERPTIALAAKLWMTPSVSNSQGNQYTRDRGQPGQERLTLTGQAQQWQTPRATDGTKGGPNQAGSKGDLMLPSAAAQWPTPASRDWKGTNSTAHIETNGTGRRHMDQLPNFVEHHFLPQALPIHDGQTSCEKPHGSPRRLTPAFGAWLLGWPWWWTNPALTSSVKSAMASYRRRLGALLSSLLGDRDV